MKQIGARLRRSPWGWVILVLSLSLAVTLTSRAAVGGERKSLSGHLPPGVSNLVAFGDFPATNQLRLAIGLPLRDPQGVETFLAQVYDPASPLYRQYLTPDEFTSRFGPTAADYDAVSAFARANQLVITATHSNRMVLDVMGSVAAIQQAFNLTLRHYHHPTENRDFHAPDVEPSVPISLAIADVSGLNDFVRPRPRSLHVQPAVQATASPRVGSGSGGSYFGKDFRAAYLPGVTLNGAGQIVGLLEFDSYYPADIVAYETAAGLSQVPLQNILLDGASSTPTTGPNSGDSEVSLDIEMAIAMAPGLAKVVIFNAGPYGLQNDILVSMVANPQIKQFSCSWGWPGGPSATTDAHFQQLAAQGQSFFSASGDSDAYTTGATSVNGVDNTSLAGAPSSSPYITVVGGTTLTTSGPGGAWVAEKVWNWGSQNGTYVGSSGGVSSYYGLPTWQSGISMAANGGSTAHRNLPDVALTADNILVYYGNGSSGTLGGTSCAAPLWAAVTALMNQQALAAGRSTMGFLNPALYALAKGSSYPATFHDITTGNNFSSSSPAAFAAVAGYDLATGWGTPAGAALINALTGPPDPLGVSPTVGFVATGPVGGPFNSTNTSVLLTNRGSGNLPWAVFNPAVWLAASPSAGVLAPGATTNVSVWLAATATALPAAIYATNLIFTNGNTHVTASVAFSLQSGQSVVQNGGFEAGDFSNWSLVGNTVVVGRHNKVTIYNAVESSANYPAVVHSGSYGAFLADVQLATLSQTVSTVAGRNYLLSFWVANPTAGATQIFRVNWSASGGPTNGLLAWTSPPALGWTNLQFFVQANSASSILQFVAENTPAEFGLDDVSLLELPTVQLQGSTLPSGNLQLSWNSFAGLVYQVQYKSDWNQAVWNNLGLPLNATGAPLAVTDPAMQNPSTQRFYRLFVDLMKASPLPPAKQ